MVGTPCRITLYPTCPDIRPTFDPHSTYAMWRERVRLETCRVRKGQVRGFWETSDEHLLCRTGTHNPLVVGSIPTGPTGLRKVDPHTAHICPRMDFVAKAGQVGSWRQKIDSKGRPRSGVYEFRVYLGTDAVTGAPLRESCTWKGPKSKLATELASWVTDLKKETSPTSTEASMAWLIEKYMELLDLEGRSPTTLAGYRSKIDTWITPRIGHIGIDNFTAGDLRELEAAMAASCATRHCTHPPKRHRAAGETEPSPCLECDCSDFKAGGRKASTIRQVHAIVQGALAFAVLKGYTDRNVALLFKRPSQTPTDVVAATPDECDQLYQAAGPPGSDVATSIALGAMLGRREGELCALRWSDVVPRTRFINIWQSAYALRDGKGSRLKDTKSHAVTEYPMSRVLIERLRERRNWQRARALKMGVELIDDPFILSRNANGSGPPRPDGYSSSFGRVRTKVDLPHLHFHSLRHYAATYLLDMGVDPVTAAKLLGHADATMILKVYAHGTDEAKRAAAAKLSGLFKRTAPPALPASTETPALLPDIKE